MRDLGCGCIISNCKNLLQNYSYRMGKALHEYLDFLDKFYEVHKYS